MSAMYYWAVRGLTEMGHWHVAPGVVWAELAGVPVASGFTVQALESLACFPVQVSRLGDHLFSMIEAEKEEP